MLTLDLLRYRVHGDAVTPIYLDANGKYLAVAEQIVAAFRSCVGGTAGQLDETLDEMSGSAPDFKVYRGLAKWDALGAAVEKALALSAGTVKFSTKGTEYG